MAVVFSTLARRYGLPLQGTSHDNSNTGYTADNRTAVSFFSGSSQALLVQQDKPEYIFYKQYICPYR
jgi:hypothetical protein